MLENGAQSLENASIIWLVATCFAALITGEPFLLGTTSRQRLDHRIFPTIKGTSQIIETFFPELRARARAIGVGGIFRENFQFGPAAFRPGVGN